MKEKQKFTIAKCGWSGGCGLVYWASHWGWGIGCDGHHRYSDPTCKKHDPTDCKWEPKSGYNPRPGYASGALPTVKEIRKQIVVSGGGYTKGNGVYTYAGVYNNYPGNNINCIFNLQ